MHTDCFDYIIVYSLSVDTTLDADTKLELNPIHVIPNHGPCTIVQSIGPCTINEMPPLAVLNLANVPASAPAHINIPQGSTILPL